MNSEHADRMWGPLKPGKGTSEELTSVLNQTKYKWAIPKALTRERVNNWLGATCF